MPTHKWKDLRAKRFSPAQLVESEDWVRREVLELNLRAVRELTGKTQVDLAEALKMTQSELSKSERRDDHLLSTLRRYVEALGGRLEVLAVFDDKQVRLKGV